jgi:pimeloyl-ACP methyl ester carboxylesterase
MARTPQRGAGTNIFCRAFAEAGYEATALSLSGHGDSPGREFLDLLSLDDYVRDVLEVMDGFDTPPVLVGHSMGGMVVQKCLEVRQVPAAVFMASVPPQGLWASAVGLAMRKPDLMSELNSLLSGWFHVARGVAGGAVRATGVDGAAAAHGSTASSLNPPA